MNNDIVVKQKPATPPTGADLAVKQPPQSAADPEPAAQEEASTAAQEKAPADAADQVSEKSGKPVGIIAAAVIVALCLITIAIYIGYNQSHGL